MAVARGLADVQVLSPWARGRLSSRPPQLGEAHGHTGPRGSPRVGGRKVSGPSLCALSPLYLERQWPHTETAEQDRSPLAAWSRRQGQALRDSTHSDPRQTRRGISTFTFETTEIFGVVCSQVASPVLTRLQRELTRRKTSRDLTQRCRPHCLAEDISVHPAIGSGGTEVDTPGFNQTLRESTEIPASRKTNILELSTY